MQLPNKHHGRMRSVFRIVWRATLCAAAVAFSLLAWFIAPASANHLGIYGAGSRVIGCSERFPVAVFATQGRYVILATSEEFVSVVMGNRKRYETQFGDIELPPPRVGYPPDAANEREALYIRFAGNCADLNLVTNVIAMSSANKPWFDPRAHLTTDALSSPPATSTAVTTSRALVAVVFAFLTVPFLCETRRILKRRRWRRSGRCAGCGYPLVGLDGERCPECGWSA